jgi:leucyl aminopeptidase
MIAMALRWKTIEICTSDEDAAEVVLIAGPPFTCRGSGAACELVLQTLARVRLTGEPGETLDVLPQPSDSSRVLGIAIGGETMGGESHWLSAGGYLVEAMAKHRIATARLPESPVVGGAVVLETILLGALLHSFQLDRSDKSDGKSLSPQNLIISAPDASCAERARRSAEAINRARAWVVAPPNLLTPPVWIDEARRVFAAKGAVVRVLGPEELGKIGAGALVAVGRGSEHGSWLLVIEWRGDATRDHWDAVMVGKGLSFDGGGLNLKARPNISKMKLDMAGGAGVLAALELSMARKSRTNVVAIVPIAENAIDALSFRPGDVVTSLSGITIEVDDTDFEGRLVLADALTYGIRNYHPTWIVDAATLTTAITSTLHEEFAGMYASDDLLAQQLIEAGAAVDERLWRMPLDSAHDYIVASDIADIRNIGVAGFFGFGIGSPTAGAKFLQKFTQGTSWAHIDMTGTAWSTRRTSRCGKGATGYGGRLLDRWLTLVESALPRSY